jgi:hypothetical protein
VPRCGAEQSTYELFSVALVDESVSAAERRMIILTESIVVDTDHCSNSVCRPRSADAQRERTHRSKEKNPRPQRQLRERDNMLSVTDGKQVQHVRYRCKRYLCQQGLVDRLPAGEHR